VRQLIPQPLDLAVHPGPANDGRGLEREDLEVPDLVRADLALRQHEEQAGELVADEEREHGAAAEAFPRGVGGGGFGLGGVRAARCHLRDQLRQLHQIVPADGGAIASQPRRECLAQRQGVQQVETRQTRTGRSGESMQTGFRRPFGDWHFAAMLTLVVPEVEPDGHTPKIGALHEHAGHGREHVLQAVTRGDLGRDLPQHAKVSGRIEGCHRTSSKSSRSLM
jgi:hypothetical protein